MIIARFRASETKDMVKKLKKMHKFTKELIDCFEDKLEEDDEDYDEDYRDEDEMSEMKHYRQGGNRTRYRSSMN